MESLNKMKLNNPIPSIELIDSPAVANAISAANNPFDSLSEVLNNFDISNHNNTFMKQLPTECLEDFFKMNLQTSGRESLAFLKDLDISPGKESLGILKLEALNASFNAENSNTPRISLPRCEEEAGNISDNPLNTAFLYSVNNRKPSVLSNNSYCTNPSLFNSRSLEGSEPSIISSGTSFKTYNIFSKSEDPLNEAFLTTKQTLKDSELNVDNLMKRRSCSAVEELNKKLGTDEVLARCSTEFQRECWSVPEFGDTHGNPLVDECCYENVQEAEDELFNNSVFIEANFLASKIATGSELEENISVNLLNSTGPPDFQLLDEFENDDYDVKIDTNTVFKAIDKMLPPQTIPLLNTESDNDKNDSFLNVPTLNNNKENIACNNTKILDESKSLSCNKFTNSHGSSSNGSSKSRNANELLHDLSEIINHEDRDPKQKLEGQQLLSGLANILCSNTSKISSKKLESSEDSGHSSIEQDEQQNEQDNPVCCQVLDLRTTFNKSNEEVLNLSMKSKDVQDYNKRSSQSFSFPSSKQPSTKLLADLKPRPSIKSSTSLDSKQGQSNNEFNKLKPKRSEQKVTETKKGPLKAVIPVGNMAKSKSFANKTQVMDSTPPKAHNSSILFKSKRTSTPISEPSIKPVAQSTPDNKFQPNSNTKTISSSSQLKKRKFYCPISPLAIPRPIGNMSSDSDLNKTNRSGSAPNLSNVSDNSKRNSRGNSLIPSPKLMHRRHSATELKITNTTNNNKMKRSYSIGKDVRPSAAASSASSSKENLANALRKQNVLQDKNAGVISRIKISGLLGKKKNVSTNKENVIH